MIISCPQCRTKFRFDREVITGDGVWVRCGRCRRVFFHEAEMARTTSPTGGTTAQGIRDKGPPEDIGDVKKLFEEINRSRGPVELSSPSVPHIEAGNPRAKTRNTSRSVILTAVLFGIIIAAAGIGAYLWLFTDIPAALHQKISSIPFLEAPLKERAVTPTAHTAAGITFVDIEDRFMSNWIVGTLLVVKGNAVNHDASPVSQVRVKGKIFDAAGKTLGDSESYCGNILTDEQIANMTEKEIHEELSQAQGSDVVNSDIAPGGSMPFMLVFPNPAGSVSEISIELAAWKHAD